MFGVKSSTMLSIGLRIRIPHDEFEISFARSGGPGGQNVNKVSSKAVLRWPVLQSTSIPNAVKERFTDTYGNRLTKDGDLIITSQKHRDQGSNIEDCIEKLREMLETVAEPPTLRRATKPTRASKERKLTTKKEHSFKKQMRRDPGIE
jgi:ribosome-associated protein